MGRCGKGVDICSRFSLMAMTAVTSNVAAMLALAYLNRFILMPRLRAAPVKRMAQITKLRYSLAVDVVLGILVLGASAILGITMPSQ
ncbi:MAG: CopD family protein [Beijerinckiaceae bacterium]